MVQQNTGTNRNTIDKFYTHPKVANKCIESFNTYVEVDQKNDIIIEPSAGNGSFIESLEKLCDNTRFYDILPENEKITQKDYLTYSHNSNSKTHVIGNPPFGRQSKLAIQFIKKSAEFANTISFILPKSFKKESLKRHFPTKFHLIFEKDLPIDSFLLNGTPYNVSCVFQIWKLKSVNRPIPLKYEPNKFRFVKKTEDYDISFRRVGVNAGKIFKNSSSERSVQSHYFIKFDNFNEDLFSKLNTCVFEEADWICGPKSVSKQELIKTYNTILAILE